MIKTHTSAENLIEKNISSFSCSLHDKGFLVQNFIDLKRRQQMDHDARIL